MEFIDDGPGKPIGINRFIGRRPVFAAGNSDGDRLDEAPKRGWLVVDRKADWKAIYPFQK